MSLSNLTSFRHQTNNNAISKERGRVPVAPASADAQPSAPAPAAVQSTRVAVERLVAADVRDLSFATIGLLTPINPKLVADLIINAGKMRRAELPLNTVTMQPLARAIVLSGEKRRGRELSASDEQFLADFLAEADPS
jgi:hypothetical protein